MTARDLINRRFRTVMLVVYFGAALFIGAIVADKALGMPQWVWVPGLIGFAFAWLTMAGAYVVGFRCPSCRKRLTPLLIHGTGLGLDSRVRYCPYCGEDLDAERAGKESGT